MQNNVEDPKDKSRWVEPLIELIFVLVCVPILYYSHKHGYLRDTAIQFTSILMVLIFGRAVQSIFQGGKVNANSDSETGSEFKLVDASKQGRVGIVQELLTKGTDVNAKDHNGVTALIRASANGHMKVMELLLTNNADVNAKANNGVTALIAASQYEHVKVMELLLANNADVNANANNGVTALIVASKLWRMKAVELLLANNADVNAKDNAGRTPLFYAMKNGSKDIAALLRTHGSREQIMEK
jgi:hypothetical protein